METTDFIRETLDRITPAILNGETKLTPDNDTRTRLHLKKEAVRLFAIGKLAMAKEINIFIQSDPKFKIWPGNGLLFMAQNSGEPDKDKIIIYSKPDHVGEYEKLLQKVEEIQSKSNE